MVKFFLLLLRPFERFLAQWISISTEPTAFVRERIRLRNTTNFLRAVGFLLSAISTVFLAEVATLHLLGIGGLFEPYYWLFILLTSIPFILFSFLFIRLVAPLSFKDVLHLSLYPIGAGVFTGAAFALVASTVIAVLVAAGLIPEVKFDTTQWGAEEQVAAVKQRVLNDCLKEESLVFTILAVGLQEAYTQLRPPIDALSYLRPLITVLYLVIAARIFMAAVNRRKGVIFSLVLLAALVATGATALSLSVYLNRKIANSSCQKTVVESTIYRMGESSLKRYAQDLEAFPGIKDHPVFDISVRAEGRTLSFTYRLKVPIEVSEFYRLANQQQKILYEGRCSKSLMTVLKATETHTFYSAEGERLISFSIDGSDCPQW